MHYTALQHGKLFFDSYLKNSSGLTIVEIGSQDVNGSLKSVAPSDCKYIGLDFVPGPGVDIVISDPYNLPLDDNSVDVVVSSSCFEHSEFFWVLFNDVQRVLKDNGLFYLQVPSNGAFHRYPVDCWRFYPDSGMALQNWARRSGYKTTLLESFIGNKKKDIWNDFVAVYVKDNEYSDQYPNRISEKYRAFTNGRTMGREEFENRRRFPEDLRRNPWWRLKRLLRKLV